jgi:hypothetical protein
MLARLCRGLLVRRLYKVIDLSQVKTAQADTAFAATSEAIQSAGGEVAYDLFMDEPAHTTYTPHEPDADGFYPSDGILVRDAQGHVTDFAEHSPLVAALNRQLLFRRLHVAEEWRDLAAGICFHNTPLPG